MKKMKKRYAAGGDVDDSNQSQTEAETLHDEQNESELSNQQQGENDNHLESQNMSDASNEDQTEPEILRGEQNEAGAIPQTESDNSGESLDQPQDEQQVNPGDETQAPTLEDEDFKPDMTNAVQVASRNGGAILKQSDPIPIAKGSNGKLIWKFPDGSQRTYNDYWERWIDGGMTRPEANHLLDNDIKDASQVLNQVKVPLDDGQKNALISHAFHMGVGAPGLKQAVQLLNNGSSQDDVLNALGKDESSNGRRDREANLYTGDSKTGLKDFIKSEEGFVPTIWDSTKNQKYDPSNRGGPATVGYGHNLNAHIKNFDALFGPKIENFQAIQQAKQNHQKPPQSFPVKMADGGDVGGEDQLNTEVDQELNNNDGLNLDIGGRSPEQEPEKQPNITSDSSAQFLGAPNVTTNVQGSAMSPVPSGPPGSDGIPEPDMTNLPQQPSEEVSASPLTQGQDQPLNGQLYPLNAAKADYVSNASPITTNLEAINGPQDKNSIVPEWYKQGQESITEKGNVEAQSADLQNQSIADDMVNRQALMDSFQQHLQNINQNRQDAIKKLQTQYIDPKQYLNNMPEGQKIATGIGLFLGGMSMPFTHQGNPAMDFLNRQIDRNIETQRANAGITENMLDTYTKMYGDEISGETATRIGLNDMMTQQAKYIAAKQGTPMAQANALAAQAQWGSQNAALINQMAFRQNILDAYKTSGGAGVQAMDLAHANMMSPEDAVKEQAAINEREADHNEANNIFEELKKEQSNPAFMLNPMSRARVSTLEARMAGLIIKNDPTKRYSVDMAKDMIHPYFTTRFDTQKSFNAKLNDLHAQIDQPYSGKFPNMQRWAPAAIKQYYSKVIPGTKVRDKRTGQIGVVGPGGVVMKVNP